MALVLSYVDSKGQRKVIGKVETAGEIIEKMMEHKASRFVHSSGAISIPANLEKNSCYTINQESDNGYYQVLSEEE